MANKFYALPLFGFLALKLIFQPQSSDVLGTSTIRSNEPQDISQAQINLKTITAFDVTETTEEEEIPFETKYEEDENMDYGTQKTRVNGKLGKKTLTYKVVQWQNELIDKSLIATNITTPETEIITKGTKITWKLYSTPDVGRIKYWHTLEVFATKYDANCEGCTGRTYSGTAVRKGVCATDPKVIPLGTNFYVEGYGPCRAEDIGGLIKGNRIDLGYEDVSKGEWRTGNTTIYLLTNPPQ